MTRAMFRRLGVETRVDGDDLPEALGQLDEPDVGDPARQLAARRAREGVGRGSLRPRVSAALIVGARSCGLV